MAARFLRDTEPFPAPPVSLTIRSPLKAQTGVFQSYSYIPQRPRPRDGQAGHGVEAGAENGAMGGRQLKGEGKALLGLCSVTFVNI